MIDINLHIYLGKMNSKVGRYKHACNGWHHEKYHTPFINQYLN